MIPSLEQEKQLAKLPKREQGRARQAIFRAAIEADRDERDNLLSDPQATLSNDPVAQALFRGIDPERMRKAGYSASEISAMCIEVASHKKKLELRAIEQRAHLAKLKSRLAEKVSKLAAIRAETAELKTKLPVIKVQAATFKSKAATQASPWQRDASRTAAKPAQASQSPSAARPNRQTGSTFEDASDQTLLKTAAGKAGPDFVAGAAAELVRRGWSPLPRGGWSSPSKATNK